MDIKKLSSIIESLLFAGGEPISISRIAKIAETGVPDVENALMALSAEADAAGRGISIVRKGNEVQMATSPGNAPYVEKLVKSELQETLSPAALEVISIVAYRGPITRADIESIRGVNSSYTLRNLLLRGLVERKENPKDARSYIYRITFDFLNHLGLGEQKKLPDFENFQKDERISSIVSPDNL